MFQQQLQREIFQSKRITSTNSIRSLQNMMIPTQVVQERPNN
ncbi:unnamed protein product [Onchocerca flexuosa]|uniref:Uncharacterized protein n=1 Tax=Onchocerca flexuosa TaxID=387005 RepID=A0A183HU39_9BILA|nr:unnamed protein product [Onchocerca flexuosa]